MKSCLIVSTTLLMLFSCKPKGQESDPKLFGFFGESNKPSPFVTVAQIGQIEKKDGSIADGAQLYSENTYWVYLKRSSGYSENGILNDPIDLAKNSEARALLGNASDLSEAICTPKATLNTLGCVQTLSFSGSSNFYQTYFFIKSESGITVKHSNN